jgi:hypothetical protein
LDADVSYKLLDGQLKLAQEKGYDPFKIDLDRIDDGNGIEMTLISNSASWHKSCRTKLSVSKIDSYASAKKRTLDGSEAQHGGSPVKARRLSNLLHISEQSEPTCFFCDGLSGDAGLHRASTFALDENVRRYDVMLKNTQLLRKHAGGDMVAIEARYHKRCLSALYNRASQVFLGHQSNKADREEDQRFRSIALAELLSYIEEARKCEQGLDPVFRLAHLVNMYKDLLIDLGVGGDVNVNSTRLKDSLLSYCPSLSVSKKGNDVMLAFHTDIGDALKRACQSDFDAVAINLARAAHIVRR